MSPVGLLIHYTNCVPGAVHDFRLYKVSGLEEMLLNENQRTQRLFGTDATVLGDSGYQRLSARVPGALTPYKRSRGRQLTEEQTGFNLKIALKRIIVENWFGRPKFLWTKISQKYRNNKGASFNTEYDMNWTFCAALTKYHIQLNPQIFKKIFFLLKIVFLQTFIF